MYISAIITKFPQRTILMLKDFDKAESVNNQTCKVLKNQQVTRPWYD